MTKKLTCILTVAVLGLFTVVFETRGARAEMPVFSVQDGLAIGGYDPVAFFVERRSVRGVREYTVMWKGVHWQFVSVQNQMRFESNPRAYAPRFGGYCAYGVANGYLLSGDPHSWEIVDGQLFLLHNPQVHEIWEQAPAENLGLAQVNWPGVLGP